MLRTKSLSFLLALAIPFAVAVPAFAPATAFADPAPAAAEAAPRVATTATFERYVVGPHGRPIGLMLSDGRFVMTPRHAMRRDAPALNAGDALQIEAVAFNTPTGVVLGRAVVQRDGTLIADGNRARRHHEHHEGAKTERHERHAHTPLAEVAATGKIARVIDGPRGHVVALVLEDGTTAVAHHLEAFGLKAGDSIAVAGKGGVYPQGKALRIEKITLPSGEVRDIPRHVRHAPAADQYPT